jgi:hypothetical protein
MYLSDNTCSLLLFSGIIAVRPWSDSGFDFALDDPPLAVSDYGSGHDRGSRLVAYWPTAPILPTWVAGAPYSRRALLNQNRKPRGKMVLLIRDCFPKILESQNPAGFYLHVMDEVSPIDPLPDVFRRILNEQTDQFHADTIYRKHRELFLELPITPEKDPLDRKNDPNAPYTPLASSLPVTGAPLPENKPSYPLVGTGLDTLKDPAKTDLCKNLDISPDDYAIVV